MTMKTMAHRATADTALRGKANPASATQATRPSVKRVFPQKALGIGIASSLVIGFQFLGAGPAAVATLPSALLARHQAPNAVQQAAAAPISLLKDGNLFAAILDEAFPHALQPAVEPRATSPEDPDEILTFGSKRAPRWLVETILKAAQVTGVDPVYMMTLADVESSLSPGAKAPTSSAAGLFQFIDKTWLEIIHMRGASHGYAAAAAAVRMVDDEPVVADESKRAWLLGLKRDPYLSALMAGELIKDVARALQSQGERELAEAELYLAHFFGATTAVRFLKILDESPDAVAAKLFPRAAKANLSLFSERKGRKRRPITVSELYDRIDSKIVGRLNRYDTVALPDLATNVQQAAAVPGR